MDSAVKMMEVDESPIKESTQTMRSNGEVNGSCDDASMDTCSSPTSSQQPPDSANSNDSSRFTEIQQQKVPTSEVPTEKEHTEENDSDCEPNNRISDGEEDEDEEADANEDEEEDEGEEEDDEHTGDTERSEKENDPPETNASDKAVSEQGDLANGTEKDDDDDEDDEEEEKEDDEEVDEDEDDEEGEAEVMETDTRDGEDAISINSGSSEEPPIESVNIGDSDNSEDESDVEHSDTIELHSDGGANRHSDTESRNSNVSRRKEHKNRRERKVKSTDSGDITIVENDSEHNKSNGEVCSSPDVQEICDLSKDKDSSSEIVNLDASPSSKKKKKSQPIPETITPRRSSRNLNKQKSYAEPREEDIIDDTVRPRVHQMHDNDHDDDDIEEITPEDPLGCADPLHPPILQQQQQQSHRERPRPSSMSGGTIVVKDTKRLVEIANTSKPSTPSQSTGKKEPTLVIIDTNSILSGRGPVPVTHKPSMPAATSYSVLPMALPAQGVYPANMRATITPIPMQHKPVVQQQQQQIIHHSQQQQYHQPQAPVTQPNILPSLTDDMYVVEAPSFIVPYVYEKPPIKPLKEFVVQYGKEVEKAEREEEEREKAEKKKEKSEGGDNEDSDDEESKKENGTSDDSNEGSNSKEKLDLSKGADFEALLDATKRVTPDTTKKPDTNAVAAVKSNSYFDNPLGKFFFNIGFNLVQEFVQTDLLKQQKRKRDREGGAATNNAIASLIKNLEFSKENNEPYHMEMKKCDYCSFRTESALALAHHLETPHMRNYVYRCNFCPLEVRSPHDILYHMEAEHNTRGRLERAPAFHQCPNCPFEDNQKGKLSRHLIACAKKFKPEKNMEPPVDWEPPAKIPRLSRGKQQVALVPGAAPYPTFTQNSKNIPILPQRLATPQSQQALLQRQRVGAGSGITNNRPNIIGKVPLRSGMLYRPNTPGQVLVPTTYHYGGNQIYTVVGGNGLGVDAEKLTIGNTSVKLSSVRTQAGSNLTMQASQSASITATSSNRSVIPSKLVHQPSISITPLPRQSSNNQSNSSANAITAAAAAALSSIPSMPMPSVKPGDPAAGKATFVICEICDGYIKDLEQLRNHMQWIHKVKIHPKMIYNRPPLNCQKCQFRFFTDQGLERHLLGSHGLVTSSMQEAANKGKDAGRCPVCGRVYQWKLLNHVARDHKITLKPAHLSYKCTVCTATFGMYKQFENHVYSAHSVVAKRVIDKKNNLTPSASSSVSSRNSESLLKPLKINDEITIIPQPAKPKASTSNRSDKGK